eukprot:scaffold641_cov373-Pavlova_lutheri.AAC.14
MGNVNEEEEGLRWVEAPTEGGGRRCRPCSKCEASSRPPRAGPEEDGEWNRHGELGRNRRPVAKKTRGPLSSGTWVVINTPKRKATLASVPTIA